MWCHRDFEEGECPKCLEVPDGKILIEEIVGLVKI